jgi:hypothetical protein
MHRGLHVFARPETNLVCSLYHKDHGLTQPQQIGRQRRGICLAEVKQMPVREMPMPGRADADA